MSDAPERIWTQREFHEACVRGSACIHETLVLSHKMQRDAFQMDHDKALRGNRAKAGRIAREALAATNRILTKGVCSNAKHG